MKLARIKIILKDGSIVYYIDKDNVTSFQTSAKTFSLSYAQGLCKGLNDSFHIYEDKLVDHCEVEII